MRIWHPAARKLAPQKITRGEINAILRRLQTIDNYSKASGCRMGLIGDNGMKVWRYLAYSFMAKEKPAFPSYQYIADAVNIARSTVVEACARLKRVGALNWTQRPGRVKGRRVQGTNLFTLHMPAQEAHKLPLLARAAKVVAKAVATVCRSANLPSIFSETDKRPHGATEDNQSDRLRAALTRMEAARRRKAERRGREGLIC